MKKELISTTIALLTICNLNAQRICGTQHHLQIEETSNPSVIENRKMIDESIDKYISENGSKQTRTIITIPVVVHVIYNTAIQNISDAQINSQITALNQDFNASNPDISKTPAAFQSVIGNAGIQFCLAKRDPNGVATTGIIRKSTTHTSFVDDDSVKFTAQGGDNAWDNNQYLNIWVCNLSSGILGYAQYPGGYPSTDGVVILYKAFGTTGTLLPVFNKGRTATHEIGHWLNLMHIWGDDNGACTGSDLVNDTPNQGAENYGSPIFPHISCSNGPTGDMFMNYMDYVNDSVMYLFTAGQAARIQALMNGPVSARTNIKNSLGCTPVPVPTCSAPINYQTTLITKNSAHCTWDPVPNALGYTLVYWNQATAITDSIKNLTNTYADLVNLLPGKNYGWIVYTKCNNTLSSPLSYGYTLFPTLTDSTICTDNYESNENITYARGIPLDYNITSQISTPNDNDFYYIYTTPTKKIVRFTLSNLPADYDLILAKGKPVILNRMSLNYGLANESITFYDTLNPSTSIFLAVVVSKGRVGFSTTACYTLRAELFGTSDIGTHGLKSEENTEVKLETSNKNLIIQEYPNPSNGNFTLNIFNNSDATNAQIKIVDITGKLVYTKQVEINKYMNEQKIETDLADGMYQIIVNTQKEVTVQKIIIHH